MSVGCWFFGIGALPVRIRKLLGIGKLKLVLSLVLVGCWLSGLKCMLHVYLVVGTVDG